MGILVLCMRVSFEYSCARAEYHDQPFLVLIVPAFANLWVDLNVVSSDR
jgi:hypothetical protein